MIVSIYAAILALVYVQLSMYVVKARRKAQKSIGTGEDEGLIRAIRAHGNFIEYVPFALILLFLNEYQGLASHYCHLFGAALVLGRLLHASNIAQSNEQLKIRVVSMVLTFSVIVLLAISLLLDATLGLYL
ncbi:Inner membrane protein YecN [Pseudoalteromonas sp. THAF3]|uniref:Glutathione metabolism protein n=1 Tax=Pseudoalteromonas ruthenica TaxID=151081 RepID=A0A5S3Z9S9_9GAMM|nr:MULTISPECIES: MAPEG family protein [Pseudoalteromonas]MCG7564918.1 MAPEG family protein [Pseudoalteromonas sp. CnMc7-15]QFU04861.1 Inner membrane protein YecN [Pseudoalteromonas sp. THAF3]RZF84493.1 glutathione metabolism protein [Pseudoalteromonas sp. CO325X]TMP88336.1 glutathione metabolism protein [Pseudoalteromonas ruthenica]